MELFSSECKALWFPALLCSLPCLHRLHGTGMLVGRKLQALSLDCIAVGHMRIALLPATLCRSREALRCSCEVRHLTVTHLDPVFPLVVWMLSFAPFFCTQSLKYLWALQSFLFLGTPKLLFPVSSLSQLGNLSCACRFSVCLSIPLPLRAWARKTQAFRPLF